jgi:hypothetical protein
MWIHMYVASYKFQGRSTKAYPLAIYFTLKKKHFGPLKKYRVSLNFISYRINFSLPIHSPRVHCLSDPFKSCWQAGAAVVPFHKSSKMQPLSTSTNDRETVIFVITIEVSRYCAICRQTSSQSPTQPPHWKSLVTSKTRAYYPSLWGHLFHRPVLTRAML